jgi:hypothetical protein
MLPRTKILVRKLDLRPILYLSLPIRSLKLLSLYEFLVSAIVGNKNIYGIDIWAVKK